MASSPDLRAFVLAGGDSNGDDTAASSISLATMLPRLSLSFLGLLATVVEVVSSILTTRTGGNCTLMEGGGTDEEDFGDKK